MFIITKEIAPVNRKNRLKLRKKSPFEALRDSGLIPKKYHSTTAEFFSTSLLVRTAVSMPSVKTE